MKTPDLTSPGRVTDVCIAALQLFLVGFFAWQPVWYGVMLLWSSALYLQIVPMLLVFLCVLAVITFSILFAAQTFRGYEVTNLARVLAIINSFVLFVFGAVMVVNLGGAGISGFFFFLLVMDQFFLPVSAVVALLAAIGCISLLLRTRKRQ